MRRLIVLAALAAGFGHVPGLLAATCNSLSGGNWNNGAIWSCGATPVAGDVVTINNGHNVSLNGANRACAAFTVNAGGTLTDGGNRVTASGNVVMNGTWTGSGGGRLIMSGANVSLDGAGTFNNLGRLDTNGSSTKTILATANLTFAGANGRIDVRAADTVINNGTVTLLRITGANATTSVWTNAAGATLNISADLLATGTLNASAAGNTVNYTGAAQTVELPALVGGTATYHHLTLSGSGAMIMPAAALAINGNFSHSGTAATTATAGGAMTVAGNFTIGANATFSGSTFTHSVGGDFSNSGTFTASTSTITLNGSVAQAIGGSSTTTFNNLTITNTSAAVTVSPGTNITNVSGTLNMNGAGTLLTPNAALVLNSAGAAGTITGTGTVQVTRTAATADYSSQYKFTTNTLTNLTVEYIGTAAQIVSALTYGSGTGGGLKISNTSAAVSAAANFAVNGTLTMNGTATLLTPAAGVVINSAGAAGTITGTGTVQVTRTAATADYSSQYKFTTNTLANLTVEYIAAAAQTVSALTYGGLKINNASGVTLGGNATVNGTLTLTAGLVNTSSFTLSIGSSGTISGAGTTRHVVGNLEKAFPAAAGAFTYELGDGTNYTPLTVNFGSAPSAGNLTAVVTNTEHPNSSATTSGVDPNKSINRYWTVKNPTLAGTANITLNYIGGSPVDNDNPVTLANFRVRRGATCSGSGAARSCTGGWSSLTLSGTPSSTQAAVTGVSIASGASEADLAIGEVAKFAREKEFVYSRERY